MRLRSIIELGEEVRAPRDGAEHLAILVADQREQEQSAVGPVARIGGEVDEHFRETVEVEIGIAADHIAGTERPADRLADEHAPHRVGERLPIGGGDVGLLRMRSVDDDCPQADRQSDPQRRPLKQPPSVSQNRTSSLSSP